MFICIFLFKFSKMEILVVEAKKLVWSCLKFLNSFTSSITFCVVISSSKLKLISSHKISHKSVHENHWGHCSLITKRSAISLKFLDKWQLQISKYLLLSGLVVQCRPVVRKVQVWTPGGEPKNFQNCFSSAETRQPVNHMRCKARGCLLLSVLCWGK